MGPCPAPHDLATRPCHVTPPRDPATRPHHVTPPRDPCQALEMFFLQRGRVQIRCVKPRDGDATSTNLLRWQQRQLGGDHSHDDEVVLDEQEAVSYFGEVRPPDCLPDCLVA
eukprot:3327019-Prymnesium_polylepis.1